MHERSPTTEDPRTRKSVWARKVARENPCALVGQSCLGDCTHQAERRTRLKTWECECGGARRHVKQQFLLIQELEFAGCVNALLASRHTKSDEQALEVPLDSVDADIQGLGDFPV